MAIIILNAIKLLVNIFETRVLNTPSLSFSGDFNARL